MKRGGDVKLQSGLAWRDEKRGFSRFSSGQRRRFVAIAALTCGSGIAAAERKRVMVDAVPNRSGSMFGEREDLRW
jgi:hypothetical protein